MPRSGFGAALTSSPRVCRRSTTPLQLEESANAPCTSTTVRGALLVSDMRAPFLVGVDVDDGVDKGLRGFLREVVSDPALDRPVRIAA